MLCNEEPLPFEMDQGYWERIQPRAVAGLLRNLLQRKPLLRLTVDDVLRVRCWAGCSRAHLDSRRWSHALCAGDSDAGGGSRSS